MSKRLMMLLLLFTMLLSFSFPIYALNNNSITLNERYINEEGIGENIVNDHVKIVKIASYDGNKYQVEGAFKTRVQLNNMMTASDYHNLAMRLSKYVKEFNVPCNQEAISNQQGKTTFRNLVDGMYLIYQDNKQFDYRMDPFIISMPQVENGVEITSLVCEPKFIKRKIQTDINIPVKITPMDITIYNGGKGYSGVIGDDGHFASNDLPEIGFYLTLPDEVNEMIGSSPDHPVDLSDKISVIYNDENETTRLWNLRPYGTTKHSTSTRYGRRVYIYKIEASYVNDTNKKVPVRMQFSDRHGNVMVDSKFPTQLTDQYRNYEMTFFTGDLNSDCYYVKVQSGNKSITCPLDLGTGILKTRGNINQYYAEISDDLPQVKKNQMLAQTAQPHTTYFINHSDVEVDNQDGVKLLVDETLDDPILKQYVEEHHNQDHKYYYRFCYMDIVDTLNGNDYLTMGKGQSMKVYWPVPSDAKKDSAFYVIHFENMERETNTSIETMLEKNVPKKLATKVVYLDGKKYVEFSTESFSPFALLYEKEKFGFINTGDYTNSLIWLIGLFMSTTTFIILFKHRKNSFKNK